jgi:hypothetical protein
LQVLVPSAAGSLLFPLTLSAAALAATVLLLIQVILLQLLLSVGIIALHILFCQHVRAHGIMHNEQVLLASGQSARTSSATAASSFSRPRLLLRRLLWLLPVMLLLLLFTASASLTLLWLCCCFLLLVPRLLMSFLALLLILSCLLLLMSLLLPLLLLFLLIFTSPFLWWPLLPLLLLLHCRWCVHWCDSHIHPGTPVLIHCAQCIQALLQLLHVLCMAAEVGWRQPQQARRLTTQQQRTQVTCSRKITTGHTMRTASMLEGCGQLRRLVWRCSHNCVP